MSVNTTSVKLKESLTAAVDRNVPSKVTFGHRRHPPWLTKSVRKLILRRDRLAKAAKKSGTQIDRNKYRKARNAATSGIQDEYQKHLNNVIGNVDSDPRAFYRFIKSRRTDTIGIPSLKPEIKCFLLTMPKPDASIITSVQYSLSKSPTFCNYATQIIRICQTLKSHNQE